MSRRGQPWTDDERAMREVGLAWRRRQPGETPAQHRKRLAQWAVGKGKPERRCPPCQERFNAADPETSIIPECGLKDAAGGAPRACLAANLRYTPGMAPKTVARVLREAHDAILRAERRAENYGGTD